MTVLEQRQNPANPFTGIPWHPETHAAFDVLNPVDLPQYEARPAGSPWEPTGFTIGGDEQFVRKILKDRFFHNPAVGYAFRAIDGMVVEFEKVATKQ
jgi:hypothetical protein